MVAPHSQIERAVIMLLFLLSGATALIYEVFWMRQLGLLFGNSSYAIATTLAAFFLGLALGGAFWGMRADQLRRPLVTYGLLELAVAVSVGGYFLILDGYYQLYPLLFGWFGDQPLLFLSVKFVLAMVILVPPAFFLGGTLPVISHFLVAERSQLGRTVSLLYGLNTFGAASGALLAGFYLPLQFGFEQSYRMTMALTALIGFAAIGLANREKLSSCSKPEVAAFPEQLPRQADGLPRVTLFGLALLSGFITLALQVLWNRMFAQVLQNSVYTFALILVTFLLALAFGAVVANRLMRCHVTPINVVVTLLTLGALLLLTAPFLFDWLTDGLRYYGAKERWSRYLGETFGLIVAVIGPPLLVLGVLFPYLLKLAEPDSFSVGRLVGQLSALNTVGAIVGSLVAGFLLLDTIGLWSALRLLAVIDLLAALALMIQLHTARRAWLAVPMTVLLLSVSLLDPARLPMVRYDPVNEDESLLEVLQGSAATVAVIRRGEATKIKVNNYYTLGGSGSRDLESLQGYLPVVLHRQPDSVYMLGLGTGISAGAVLHLPVKQLIVTELLAEVVTVAERYFGRYNNRLFFDSRARVIAEDGRNYLAATDQRFDIIIADLFVPWRAGVGSLYSVEHYRAVRDHLKPGGLFMQWLPAYQLSEAEFGVIVRTLRTVFPQLTMWRGDFSTRKPVIGLLAQSEIAPLSSDALLFSMEQEQRIPLLAHYIGDTAAIAARYQKYPINRDDRPIIEYQAPITQREQKKQQTLWLNGEALIELMSDVRRVSAVKYDGYLSQISPAQQQLPTAGMALHQAQLLKRQGYRKAAQSHFERYQTLIDLVK